ncbi:hypothetical protein LZK75_27625 (plasmid) [Rhizobium leguminosarum]|nr:hypothetical protein LZK75_27625 [Rhizobium leguminosarum]
MTKRKRAFFVKRVRDGKKGFAKADYGKREVAIEDIGKSSGSPKSLSIKGAAKDTRWHSPFHTIGERF